MFADISQETVTTFWIVAVSVFAVVGALTVAAARRRGRSRSRRRP